MYLHIHVLPEVSSMFMSCMYTIYNIDMMAKKDAQILKLSEYLNINWRHNIKSLDICISSLFIFMILNTDSTSKLYNLSILLQTYC